MFMVVNENRFERQLLPPLNTAVAFPSSTRVALSNIYLISISWLLLFRSGNKLSEERRLKKFRSRQRFLLNFLSSGGSLDIFRVHFWWNCNKNLSQWLLWCKKEVVCTLNTDHDLIPAHRVNGGELVRFIDSYCLDTNLIVERHSFTGWRFMIAFSEPHIHSLVKWSVVASLFSAISTFLSIGSQVFYQRMIGYASYGEMSLFFSLIGFLTALLMWPMVLLLYFTGSETIHWNSIPWLPLSGAAGLNLGANVLGYFGLNWTYEIFLSLGILLAIPVSAG